MYHLDPALAWQAVLKKAEGKIKVINRYWYGDFIKIYNKYSDEGYFLVVDAQYPEIIHEHNNDLKFLPERMKIEKVDKLATNLHDKTEYVIHIRNLKHPLNHGLVLKNVHAWLNSYIDMDTKLRKKAKKIIWGQLLKLINNAVLWRT